MSKQYEIEYERWLKEAKRIGDANLEKELLQMAADEREDAFYRQLEFGTAGLRGRLGAGTNRMNRYNVARVSQGLADYIKEKGGSSVAISYDNRRESDTFSRVASSVFAANGIHVHLYPELMPTPCLSFAVRYYKCFAGVMITASHNPAEYNGYKVYDATGCQITDEAAKQISREIEKLDAFCDVQCADLEEAQRNGFITKIAADCEDAFLNHVKACSVLYGESVPKDMPIVYSPLYGTGCKPVLRVLKEAGFTNVTVVEEQALPNGDFPTCPKPNPEEAAALELAIACAKRVDAQLVMATDPDADRIGIAEGTASGEYRLFTGNEVGILLADFICTQRTRHECMPSEPVIIKTIVSTPVVEQIAAHYGVQVQNLLTGFKYIGEAINGFESAGEEKRFLFGFEESYGYLSGTHVRDKDAVNAALLIAEMYAYYQAQGISLAERLEELYRAYGYTLNSTHSYAFEGAAGAEKMRQLMAAFRAGVDAIGPCRVVSQIDYLPGWNGLPSADVLQLEMEHDCKVVIRPSGTEPKLKFYCFVTADSAEKARQLEAELIQAMERRIL